MIDGIDITEKLLNNFGIESDGTSLRVTSQGDSDITDISYEWWGSKIVSTDATCGVELNPGCCDVICSVNIGGEIFVIDFEMDIDLATSI